MANAGTVVNKLGSKMQFELMGHIKEHYTGSGLNDVDFAEAAGHALGFQVTKHNVSNAREALGIASNVQRGKPAAAGDCATKEDLAVVLEAVRELTKRLDSCSKRIETYFTAKG